MINSKQNSDVGNMGWLEGYMSRDKSPRLDKCCCLLSSKALYAGKSLLIPMQFYVMSRHITKPVEGFKQYHMCTGMAKPPNNMRSMS